MQRQLINDSITFAAMTPYEMAADSINADGAHGYIQHLSTDRLADLINEHLPEDIQAAVYAQMIKEVAEEFEVQS